MSTAELLPDIQWGEDSEGTAGSWKRVSFQRAFTAVPGISGIAYARAGSLPSRTIGAVSVPRVLAVTVPRPAAIVAQKLSDLDISRISIGSPQDTVGNAMRNDVKNRLGDWGLFNWARDSIAYAAYGIGYITGAWLQWLWNLLLQPQVDRIRDRINSAISNLTDQVNSAFSSFQNAINDRLSNQTDRINDAFGTNIDNTNGAFAQFSASVTTRVNAVLTDFYNATGIPLGIIISPIHVRNITNTGFEWQSFGNTRITWIAVGRGRSLLGAGGFRPLGRTP